MRSRGMDLNSGMNTPAEWLRLCSGPFALYFDPTTVSLRRLRIGDATVVQRIKDEASGVMIKEKKVHRIMDCADHSQGGDFRHHLG